MSAFDIVSRLLGRCGGDGSILPPTALYNEGWMLRLVLDWYANNRGRSHRIFFCPQSTWYSEALLGSRFFGDKRGDSRAEGWTHADGVVGHFCFRPGGRGDIGLVTNASQLTVVEAKMGSLLSAGTKNAPTFNQAARTLACMAHLLYGAKRRPEDFDRLDFFVIAPESRVQEGAFTFQIEKPNIEKSVSDRAAAFGDAHSKWQTEWFVPTLTKCNVAALTWESLLDEIQQADQSAGIALRDFYSSCLKFNPFSPLRQALR